MVDSPAAANTQRAEELHAIFFMYQEISHFLVHKMIHKDATDAIWLKIG